MGTSLKGRAGAPARVSACGSPGLAQRSASSSTDVSHAHCRHVS